MPGTILSNLCILLKYFFGSFLCLGPLQYIKRFLSLHLKPLTFFVLWLGLTYLFRESHYNHLAALALALFIVYITERSYSQQYSLFPSTVSLASKVNRFLLSGSSPRTLLCSNRLNGVKNVKIRKTHWISFMKSWKMKRKEESTNLKLDCEGGAWDRLVSERPLKNCSVWENWWGEDKNCGL